MGYVLHSIYRKAQGKGSCSLIAWSIDIATSLDTKSWGIERKTRPNTRQTRAEKLSAPPLRNKVKRPLSDHLHAGRTKEERRISKKGGDVYSSVSRALRNIRPPMPIIESKRLPLRKIVQSPIERNIHFPRPDSDSSFFGDGSMPFGVHRILSPPLCEIVEPWKISRVSTVCSLKKISTYYHRTCIRRRLSSARRQTVSELDCSWPASFCIFHTWIRSRYCVPLGQP